MQLLHKLIVALGILLVCCPAVGAQTYRLTSQTGGPATVRLNYKLFSKRLAVSCAGDTLFLPDYTGTLSVKTMRDRFLLITYQARCGTNCSLQKAALVTVHEQKIRLALLVQSAADAENTVPGHEMTSHYRVALDMPGNAASPYTMRARVSLEKIFPRNPARNQRRHQQIALRWDAAQQVFRSKERL